MKLTDIVLNSVRRIRTAWSATQFRSPRVTEYAHQTLIDETRRGVITMAAITLILELAVLALRVPLGLNEAYVYTFSLVALLSAHVMWSARNVRDVRELHLLGMALLVITAAAYMLLAHQTGSLESGLLAGAILLFIAIPLVPWGLRETATIIVLIYTLFTLSSLGVKGRFNKEELLLLQFLIMASSMITTVLIARNVNVRKDDIRRHHELEDARQRLEQLSLKDPLTGAWNRRFLERNFLGIAQQCRDEGSPLRVALLDIDDFKQINDSYGHHFADRVLERLTEVFANLLGEHGYVVRMGGDEFQLIATSDDLESVIERGLNELQNDPELLSGTNGVPVQVSAGLAELNRPEDQPLDTLYKRADAELYVVKRARKQEPDAAAGGES